MFSSSAKSTSFFPFSPFFLPCFLIRISLIGEELDAFLQRHQPAFDRIIYIGDGSNDFCPILRLRRYVIHPCAHNPFILSLLSVNEQSEKKNILTSGSSSDYPSLSQDLVFCRRHRGLQKRIEREAERGLKAKVLYWAGAWEVEELFQRL